MATSIFGDNTQVSTLKVAGANVTAYGKNFIMNGGFNLWSRGDNSTGTGYFADRWQILQGGSSAGENATGSPVGFRRNAYIRRSVSGDLIISQRIESIESTHLEGNKVALQFHHTTASGSVTNINIKFRYATVENTFSTTTLIEEFNITDVSTATKILSSTLNMPAGVKNGLEVVFTYTCVGDTYIRLTGAKLEEGSVATPWTPYEGEFGGEVQACQRYYENSGTNLAGYISSPSALAAQANITGFRFNTPKRTTPTVVLYHGVNGTANQVYRVSDAASIGVVSIDHIGKQGVGSFTLASGSINSYIFNYTASAEL